MFLPMSREEMNLRGWHYLDFLIVSGDAYVDHPSFGVAIIGRLLESMGYKVGIIAQPDWKRAEDFTVLGQPRYAVLVTAGNIDSMVNHYTAAKKPRSEDIYTPGGQKAKRPDRASIVYANRCREVFKDKPIILGGIEASLRRFAHYDYWDDKIRRSVLIDANADLLVYGMAERQIREIAQILSKGGKIEDCYHVQGTAFVVNDLSKVDDYLEVPGYEDVVKDKRTFAQAFIMQYKEQNPFEGQKIVQAHGDIFLVQNKPAKPLSAEELDNVFKLPFTRKCHPSYEKLGGVPALNEVEFSIMSHRGCFGGCSFCALTFHQGRIIQSRSPESIIEEAKILTENPDFKGYIHDVGGPTANFRRPACTRQSTKGACKHRQCLHPEPCPNLKVDHREYIDVLRNLRKLPGVKKVFIRSGVRFDYLMYDKSNEFLKELCRHHVSGQLKVAPEHVSPGVLGLMGKPKRQVYDKFVKAYTDMNKGIAKKQYLVPYFISSHPGSTLKDAVVLAEYIRDMGRMPEQVQDFIPTPGSMSTCMYYSGLDPRTMKKIYVPKAPKEKAMQRALMQYRLPKNYQLVKEALIRAGRTDLIGYGPKCLIKPDGQSSKKMAFKTDKTRVSSKVSKKQKKNKHKVK